MTNKVTKRSNEFYDGYFTHLYSHSYMNAMTVPAVCDNVAPVNSKSNTLKPIQAPEIKFVLSLKNLS